MYLKSKICYNVFGADTEKLIFAFNSYGLISKDFRGGVEIRNAV